MEKVIQYIFYYLLFFFNFNFYLKLRLERGPCGINRNTILSNMDGIQHQGLSGSRIRKMKFHREKNKKNKHLGIL